MDRDLPAADDGTVKRPGGLVRALRAVTRHEELNFLLTNRVPRIALSRAVGWLAAIESPLLARLSIAVWRLFTDLDLSEAEPCRYTSLQQCFTRRLRPGARTIDRGAGVLVSPSDGIVGACGAVEGTRLWQAKGMGYTLAELFGRDQDASAFHDGVYVTLRLTSAMYHRFHAPHDARIVQASHIDGDAWNVNPPALARIQRLYCRNERAVVRLRLEPAGEPLALVAVAAILVSGIRLHAPGVRLAIGWRGPRDWRLDAPVARGDELGWFAQGSTILVFAPRGFALANGVQPGLRVRMGQPLLRR